MSIDETAEQIPAWLYRSLDDVASSSCRAVPRGTLVTVRQLLDRLRLAGIETDLRRTLEATSLRVQLLEQALSKGAAGDDECELHRRELGVLARCLMGGLRVTSLH
jgi:hypothetical protein